MGSSCSKKSKDTLSIESEESAYGDASATKNDEPPPVEKPLPDLSTTNSQIEQTSLSVAPPPAKLSVSDESAGTRIPKKDKSASHLPDLNIYANSTRDLIMGRISSYERKQKMKKVYLFILGDSKDCSMEREALEKEICSLRCQLDKDGIELIVLNPDLNLLFPEFPFSQVFSIIKFIEDVKSHALIVNVILLNETTGQLSLPRILSESQFQSLDILSEAERGEVTRWYKKDNFARDSQYILNWPQNHRETFRKNTPSDYLRNLRRSASECTHVAETLAKAFDFDKKKCPSKTPLELLIPQLHESNNKGRMTIWIERTLKKKEQISDELRIKHLCPNKMQEERLRDLRTDLGDKVTAGNKITYEMDLTGPNVDNSAMTEMSSKVRQRLEDIIQTQGFNSETSSHVKDGVKLSLLNEIENHLDHCKYLSSTVPDRDDIIIKVKEYIIGSSKEPLLLHGEPDCGMSSLVSRIATNCNKWLPDACIVQRFIGLSNASSQPESLVQYLFEHCLLLLGDKDFKWGAQDHVSKLLPLLGKATPDRPIILLLDGIHKLEDGVSWLPENLPSHVKLILSTAGSLEGFTDKIQRIHVTALDNSSGKKYLKSLLERDSRGLPEDVWSVVSKSPLTKLKLSVISRQILAGDEEIAEVTQPAQSLIVVLQKTFMKEPLEKVLACLTLSRLGLSDAEIYTIFIASSKETSLAAFDFLRFLNLIRPFVSRRCENGILVTNWISSTVREAIKKEFLSSDSRKLEHCKFFKENLLKVKPGVMFKDATHDNVKEITSVRCFQEGSSIEFQSTGDFSYLFNGKWLLAKLMRCGPYKVVDDINMALKKSPNSEDLKTLKGFFILASGSLDYEPSQLYTQLHQRLKWKLLKKSPSKLLSALLEEAISPPVPSLVSFAPCLIDSPPKSQDEECPYRIDDIFRIKNNPHHIISTARDEGELIVWNIHTRKAVRTLKGLKQPRNVKMIDDHKCIVLCDRELKIYNLDDGQFLMKLREMMNQRSPYFGLCDPDHVVALSRSRMNVNLMNLTNGTCVTTFKVGENRFLSSLIVSANGKICVCGDETPSSLVMWNLEERKLIYELKMQNHEYYPKLAAITDDGTYVSCVCREVEEPAPNFIVVYELQSGTLFKRWKPESDTISITISTTGITCVIVGLEDCRIMAFDLIIGNLRWTVGGHTSPADTLKVDQKGSVLLSYDSTGRDRSIRVWNLNTGASLATLTPDERITACELTNDGEAVIVTLEAQSQIHTFFLCHKSAVEPVTDCLPYGSPENHSRIFELGQVPSS